MKQLTREIKHIMTTWYNSEDNEYYIEYWNTTNSNKYVMNIYNGDLIARIKYKRHDWIEENNIFEFNNCDKYTQRLIKTAFYRYA